ncbi:MAG: xanthine dehydrogenase family protein subunit M [Proteobacteria bacterium]|nr:xanthine dehydrogenase family protein subunit M [Pseudomonadota bacterium]MBU0967393.1 xanthine dehydrogenase family protein subunit M [Pseudomonadota bacterium]
MTVHFSYVRPASLQDAMGQLTGDNARIHAGGTDLLGCLRDEVFPVDKLVSISRLDKLRGIKKTTDGGLSIGALTTIAEVAVHPLIREKYTALAQGAAAVGSPQIRNQGTLGGNLCQKPRCWYYRGEFHCLRKGGDFCYAAEGENQYHCILGGDYCYIVHPSDTAPALQAFGATLRIAGPRGGRDVSVADFFVPPSRDVTRETVLEQEEIVTEILLPPAPAGLRSAYRKVRARQAWDFALAGVALALEQEGGRVQKSRVVLSGAAPIPWRAVEVEKIINDSTLGAEVIREAAAAAMAKAVPLSKNGYKIPLFQGMLEEELEKMRGA